MHRPSLLLACALLQSLLNGCASLHYDVVAPAAQRGTIARNAGAIVARDKIDYELFQADDKLIIRFVNRTGQPLRLTEQSTTIDANGHAFAVEPQDVALDQAGRLVVPPGFAADSVRPIPVATPVRVGGVDEGGIIGSRRDVENGAAGVSAGAPAAPAAGFRWPEGRTARVRLVYRVGEDQTLTHEWTIRRVK